MVEDKSETDSIPCFASLGRSHWVPSRMSAPAKPLVRPELSPEPEEVSQAVEPGPDNPKPEASRAEQLPGATQDGAACEPQIQPVALSGGRRFGAGALVGSAFAGAASAIAVLLIFGLSHGRWERAVDLDAYAEVIDVRPASTEAPAVQPEVSREREDEKISFSSATLDGPFASGELVMPGALLTTASFSLAPDGGGAHAEPASSDPVNETASFNGLQLAGPFEGTSAPAAGAVASDGSVIIGASSVLANGTIVVDRLSSSSGEKPEEETAVLSIPAGAGQVDAVLHLITADGRIAHQSELRVVLEDKGRSTPDPQTRKAERKSAASSRGKSVKLPKANLADRRASPKSQSLPLPPTRGLFNFEDTSQKKAISADGAG